MRIYSCKVKLSGSRYNEVAKIGVTAPEILVLRRLHTTMGEDEASAGAIDPEVVTDIAHTGEVKRTDNEERMRLAALYGPALRKIETVKTVEGLFGVGNPLPQVVHDAEGVVVPDQKPKRVKIAKPAPADEADDELELA